MAKVQKSEEKKEVKKGTVVNFSGYPVRVAVFDKGERNITIKIEKSYKNKDGEYETTSNLFIDDIPKLINILNDVYSEYGITKTEPKEFEVK